MSKYLPDVQGKIDSNPVNETNTNYPGINNDEIGNPAEYHINTQYMYNHNEPVSDIDTAHYDDYRNKVEELRKRTESHYEALESCLVPAEIPGMAFQPFDYIEEEDDNGQIMKDKTKSPTYFFQDHMSPISVEGQEYVFRTNKVKFIDDRHRRLIYDRTIHLLSSREDEDNKVTFRQLLLRTFFLPCVEKPSASISDTQYMSLIRNKNGSQITTSGIIDLIKDVVCKDPEEKYYVIDNDGNDKLVEDISDFDLVLKNGQDINTGVPSSLFNLYNMGWVNAAMIFLNGIAIRWTDVILSVDNIDTFIIVSGTNLINNFTDIEDYLDDDKEIFLDYIHIPFKVFYLDRSNHICEGINEYADRKFANKVFVDPSDKDKISKDTPVIFSIALRNNLGVDSDTYHGIANTGSNQPQYLIKAFSSYYDRIICLDPNIRYAEFEIDDPKNTNISNAGINFTKSLKEFCGNDYRCKLKRFNFIGFELKDFTYGTYVSKYKGLLKNDDFDVKWHPFNIMDIRFKKLFNTKRIFKVFYNTKVLYDQDNILRIKNRDYISNEYEKYIQDVTGDIDTYLNEIYILAKKDIGTYVATDGNMINYKYTYVTPYECFLLYNACMISIGRNKITLEDFKNLNIINDISASPSMMMYINKRLIPNNDGKCIWQIKNEGPKTNPIVIVKDKDNKDVIVDVTYNADTDTIILTMNDNNQIIEESSYRAYVYYADYVQGNPDLTPASDGVCNWYVNMNDGLNGALSLTIYDTITNEVVLTDVDVSKDNSRIQIKLCDNHGSIKADTYKVAINRNKEVTRKGTLNYLAGGFIAIPKDEENVPVNEDKHIIFNERIDESDIYDESGKLKDTIRAYLRSIIDTTSTTSITDILIPIDNVINRDKDEENHNYFYYHENNLGKVLPYSELISKYKLTQEYPDMRYDVFKLRFEMTYLANMEEGATPIDEFIYYFVDLDSYGNECTKPTSMDKSNADTPIPTLNAIATNIFKHDPNKVLDAITGLNKEAGYVIPTSSSVHWNNIYFRDLYTSPMSFKYSNNEVYPYNYYPENITNADGSNKVGPTINSEWGLRRNLPEMFIHNIDKDEYTIDSMHLLDEVFDFTYDAEKDYIENLKNGTNYIIGYDADKLEQSIKRSIVSMTRTGEELAKHMKANPCKENISCDGMKYITFVKNNNYKIPFDNVKITAEILKAGVYYKNNKPTTRVSYTTEEGKTVDFEIGELKHKSQENITVVKTKYSFKDVDKNFTQEFDTVVFNRETRKIEYLLNGETVIILDADEVINPNRLQMSRWNIGQQENYVMIFKNRQLYSYYNTISYSDINFSVDFPYQTSGTDECNYASDVFEFIFFLNANNTIMKKECETDDDLKINIPENYVSASWNNIRKDANGNPMDKGMYEGITNNKDLSPAIACNTSILDAENMQLLVNVMPTKKGDTWDVANTDNTTFELEYKVLSYKAEVQDSGGSPQATRRFVHYLRDDNKLNGLYRVTKQGGGEYFLTFDGSVPKKEPTNPGSPIVNPGSSGINGIGTMAIAAKNVNHITFNGTVAEWNAISKALPWLRDANNLNNNGGIKCKDGTVKVPSKETQTGY